MIDTKIKKGWSNTYRQVAMALEIFWLCLQYRLGHTTSSAVANNVNMEIFV